jgi:MFS superfamily sulfate permease-like transporter
MSQNFGATVVRDFEYEVAPEYSAWCQRTVLEGAAVTDSANGAPAGPAPSRRPWLVFRSFQGWHPTDFGADAVAGLTLAAIAIPEQMATARLAGFGHQIGFLALLAGAIGFAIFGDSRRMSIGADSTIAPIFAGALSALAAAGSDHYAAAAGALALAVGVILVLGGVFRLGFIADLLSMPVTTGFLAGIAGHILVSQAPATLGLEDTQGALIWRAYSLISRIGSANGWTLAIGLGVLALMILSEKISPRFPAALIGLAIAALAVITLGLEARGVETLGEVAGAPLRFSAPVVSLDDLRLIAPLAVTITLVVMIQTAATTRAFSENPDGPDVNRDLVGVGVANALAGVTGAFPVDASPPRTAVVAQTRGVSQLSGLVCAAVALGVLMFGARALAHVPRAALAGVLLFIGLRIVRVGAMIDVWRRSRAEFLLSDRARDPRAADPGGRQHRHHFVVVARRLDDDARAGGRAPSHPWPRSGGRPIPASRGKPWRASR